MKIANLVNFLYDSMIKYYLHDVLSLSIDLQKMDEEYELTNENTPHLLRTT